MARLLLESEAVGVNEKAHVVCAEEAAVKATADANRMSIMNDRRRRRLPLTPARQGGTLPIPIEIGVVIFARESEMSGGRRSVVTGLTEAGKQAATNEHASEMNHDEPVAASARSRRAIVRRDGGASTGIAWCLVLERVIVEFKKNSKI